MSSTLGDFVRYRREQLGLNQTELAERADVPRETVNRLEKNKTAMPMADTRRRLARALGVSHLDVLVAAGEITRDELEATGVQGVQPVDPVRAALIRRVEEIRLLPERVGALERILDLYLSTDASHLVDEVARPTNNSPVS